MIWYILLTWFFSSHAPQQRRIERRTAREIQEYQPDDASAIESSPHNDGATNGDVGILERSRLLAKTARCKRKDTVDCVGGVNRDNITQTCAEACQDEYGVGGCCVGANACDGFTGLVCRDADTSTGFMGSCSGTDACRNAKIGSVFQSCAEGYKSCEDAGQMDTSDQWKVHVKDQEHVLVLLPIKVTLVCLKTVAMVQLSANMQLPMEAQLVMSRTRASVNNRVTILLLIKELLER